MSITGILSVICYENYFVFRFIPLPSILSLNIINIDFSKKCVYEQDCILCFDLRGRSWSRRRGWCDAVSYLAVKWMILSMLSDTVSLFTVEHLVLSNLCCEKSEMCVNISLVNTPNHESFHAKIWSTFLSFFAGRISPTFYFLYLINFSSGHSL